MSENHYLQLSNQSENQYELIDDGDMDSLKMHGQAGVCGKRAPKCS